MLSSVAPAAAASSPESLPSRQRTPLSLVAALPGRRRTPFVVFCFLALVAAMATVLVLNISVSSGQYELVQLNSAKDTLVKQNQALTQQVQNAQAPQNLAQKAQQLGMVAANSTGQINVNNQTISGSPKPAVKLATPAPLIAAPETESSTPVSVTTPVTAQQQANPLAPNALSNALPFLTSTTVPAIKQDTAKETPQPNLHGGSIPSPEQKTPNLN
ncbi:hypothetical protein UM93_02830 [Psychromicrobium lacuslunae]|uniref:Cell division protein FtsL n=1 Tax=Psychromicrobium lacuslunae TaxID=1618207 RepID=A0A0D4C353_9MICC|nr:hypothetical protein UM93_02830 [Psychromicrobium lacuslunae]